MGRSNLRNKNKKRKSKRPNTQNRRETNYYAKDKNTEY